MRLDAYIDDFTLSAHGDTEEDVEKALVAAAIDLNRVIEQELMCKVARDKSAVVGSSDNRGETGLLRSGAQEFSHQPRGGLHCGQGAEENQQQAPQEDKKVRPRTGQNLQTPKT